MDLKVGEEDSIWSELHSIREACVRIEEGLLQVRETMRDHERRIRELEAVQNKARGAFWAYSVLSGTIVGLLTVLAQVLLS